MNDIHRWLPLGGPTLLVVYGTARLIDGMDGDQGPGTAWNVGHVAFLGAFLFFALLIVGLRRLILARSAGGRTSAVANVFLFFGLIGTLTFIHVILGDLSPRWKSAFGLPDAVEILGPLAFQVGFLGLLIQLAVLQRLPVWSPILVFLGFIVIPVNLDLLPLAGILMAIGLFPCCRGALLVRPVPQVVST
jgi:hypothetical protein